MPGAPVWVQGEQAAVNMGSSDNADCIVHQMLKPTRSAQCTGPERWQGQGSGARPEAPLILGSLCGTCSAVPEGPCAPGAASPHGVPAHRHALLSLLFCGGIHARLSLTPFQTSLLAFATCRASDSPAWLGAGGGALNSLGRRVTAAYACA